MRTVAVVPASLLTAQAVESAPPHAAVTSADPRRDALATSGLSPEKKKTNKCRAKHPSQSDDIAHVAQRHINGAPKDADRNNTLDKAETPATIKSRQREYLSLHIIDECLPIFNVVAFNYDTFTMLMSNRKKKPTGGTK